MTPSTEPIQTPTPSPEPAQAGACPCYVAGFMFSPCWSRVALIRKQKPFWQKGLLNGIGGKIEPGEDALTAMVREFQEEAGVSQAVWTKFCKLVGDFEVTFFWSIGDLESLVSQEEEKIEVIEVDSIGLRRKDVIENIPWLVGLALDSIGDGRPEMVLADYPKDSQANNLAAPRRSPSSEPGETGTPRTDAVTGHCVCHATDGEDVVPRGLSCELERETTELRDALRKEQRACQQVIDERDSREATIGDIYESVMGRHPEWSNRFGLREAVDDIHAQLAAAQSALATAVRERDEARGQIESLQYSLDRAETHFKYQEKAANATLAAENAALRRDVYFARKWIARNIPEGCKDHACATCAPESEILIPGFVCEPCQAKAALAAPDAGKEGGAA